MIGSLHQRGQDMVDRRAFLAAGGVGLVGAGAGSGASEGIPSPSALPPGGPVRLESLTYGKFELGIVTYNVAAEWDLPTILRICKETSIRFVELRTTHKHGVEPTLTTDQRKDIRQKFADAGITLWGLGTVCEFHSTDRAVVEKNIQTCKEFLQLSADLGGKGVKVRPNGLHRTVPEEATLEQIGKALVLCGNAAVELEQEVWVEVHGGGTSHPPRMKKIMEVCNHPSVGITWNSNREDVKEGSVKEYFELLKPWIKSCHINALYSTYPYRELFGCLREARYDRVTLVEIPEKIDPVNGAVFLKYYKALWLALQEGGSL